MIPCMVQDSVVGDLSKSMHDEENKPDGARSKSSRSRTSSGPVLVRCRTRGLSRNLWLHAVRVEEKHGPHVMPVVWHMQRSKSRAGMERRWAVTMQ